MLNEQENITRTSLMHITLVPGQSVMVLLMKFTINLEDYLLALHGSPGNSQPQALHEQTHLDRDSNFNCPSNGKVGKLRKKTSNTNGQYVGLTHTL